MTTRQTLEESEEKDVDMWKKSIQGRGTASAKTLREGPAWCFLKTTTAGRPRWLGGNEGEVSSKRGVQRGKCGHRSFKALWALVRTFHLL